MGGREGEMKRKVKTALNSLCYAWMYIPLPLMLLVHYHIIINVSMTTNLLNCTAMIMMTFTHNCVASEKYRHISY